MNTENKGMFFPLDEESYEAVCRVANAQDKTLGDALSLLIAKGRDSMNKETEDEQSTLLDKKTIAHHLEQIYTATELVRDEVSSLLFYFNYTGNIEQSEKADEQQERL